jgi:hypothetical protein
MFSGIYNEFSFKCVVLEVLLNTFVQKAAGSAGM